jgi:hypothetical protein
MGSEDLKGGKALPTIDLLQSCRAHFTPFSLVDLADTATRFRRFPRVPSLRH